MVFAYNKIEELCKERRINITQMCRSCGISRSKLTDYKMGRIKNLTTDVVTKIADYFDVTMEYLCGNADFSNKEDELKALLFGEGFTVTDEMWFKVKAYADSLKNENEE